MARTVCGFMTMLLEGITLTQGYCFAAASGRFREIA
jgi:hypothetical protein